MHILLFAQLAIEQDGQVTSRPPTHKIGSLLALLSYFKGRFFSREVLAEMFWPESEINAGRANLRVTLTGLRHILEPPGTPPGQFIKATRTHISLRDDTIETDVHQFLSLIHTANQKPGALEKVSILENALDYYSGQLLPGFYDDWIGPEREHLEEQCIKLCDQLIEEYLLLPDLNSVVRLLQKKVTTNPYNEDYYVDLIQLLFKMGKHEQASFQYKRMENAVTQQLKQELSPIALSLRDELESASSISIGSLAGAQEKVAQPVSEMPNVSNVHHPFSLSAPLPQQIFPELPRAMTRFIGREHELEWVIKHLTDPSGHPILVTLTGNGGIGKTRLALAAAHGCKEHFNGRVLFVPLSDIENLERLIPTILQATLVPRVLSISELTQLKQFFPISLCCWCLIMQSTY